jgi:ankyrin repeat protein
MHESTPPTPSTEEVKAGGITPRYSQASDEPTAPLQTPPRTQPSTQNREERDDKSGSDDEHEPRPVSPLNLRDGENVGFDQMMTDEEMLEYALQLSLNDADKAHEAGEDKDSDTDDEEAERPVLLEPDLENWFLSAERGFLENMQMLKGKVPITAQDEQGNTALHIAVLNDEVSIIRFLLNESKSLALLANEMGEIPLHLVGKSNTKNNPELVKTARLLLQADKSQIHLQDNDGHTLLHVAAQHGGTNMVRFSLRNGADVNQRSKPDGHAIKGYTALDLAVRRMHLKIVEMILASGKVSISTRDNAHYWAIHTPVNSEQIERMEAIKMSLLATSMLVHAAPPEQPALPLIRMGAVFSPQPMQSAILGGLPEEGRRRQQPHRYNTNFTLHEIAQTGSIQQMKAALGRAKYNINGANKDGDTPLHLAVRRGYVGMAGFLLNNNADPEIRNKEGNNPLALSFSLTALKAIEMANLIADAQFGTTNASQALPTLRNVEEEGLYDQFDGETTAENVPEIPLQQRLRNNSLEEAVPESPPAQGPRKNSLGGEVPESPPDQRPRKNSLGEDVSENPPAQQQPRNASFGNELNEGKEGPDKGFSLFFNQPPKSQPQQPQPQHLPRNLQGHFQRAYYAGKQAEAAATERANFEAAIRASLEDSISSPSSPPGKSRTFSGSS